MKGSFKLGKIDDISVYIHWTFSLLILFIVYVNYNKKSFCYADERALWGSRKYRKIIYA